MSLAWDQYIRDSGIANKHREWYYVVNGMVKAALIAAVVGALMWQAWETHRAVAALNESNQIMVGVENGIPAGQAFKKADPPQTF